MALLLLSILGSLLIFLLTLLFKQQMADAASAEQRGGRGERRFGGRGGRGRGGDDAGRGRGRIILRES